MFINLTKLPLGKQIQIKRIIQGIEQRELAKAFDMHYSTLCRVEQGKQALPKKYIESVDAFLKS